MAITSEGSKRLHQRSRQWWTKERVIIGLKRFYEDFGFAPTNGSDYQKYQQFTGHLRNGRHSNQGYDQLYPSSYGVYKHFKGMRDAWAACGIITDRGDEPWTPEEEWFIVEAAGIIPREEQAQLMGRSGAAIKRRLYDMGVKCQDRWGWPVNKAEAVLGISAGVIRSYVERGEIPVFRGNRNIYLDPADLMVIKEYNWNRKRQPKELSEAVRRSLVRRLCFILLGKDWRSVSIYKPEQTRARRYKPRKLSGPNAELPSPNFTVGEWVTIARGRGRRLVRYGRPGRITSVFWSPQKLSRDVTHKIPRYKACWVARIDFRRSIFKGQAEPRTHLTVPTAVLARVEAPPDFKRPRRPGTRDRSKRIAKHQARGKALLHASVFGAQATRAKGAS